MTDRADPMHARVFLIADIRGYTRFTREHGDEAAAGLASTFSRLTGDAVEKHGGRVVELRGDEALAVFDSARQSLRAAVALQEQFEEYSRSQPEQPLQVGIGIDVGEAVPVEDGYRGGALNVAARLCGMAAPGEILTTEFVTYLAGRVQDLSYLDLGRQSLKGMEETVRVLSVQKPDASASTGASQLVGPAERDHNPTAGTPNTALTINLPRSPRRSNRVPFEDMIEQLASQVTDHVQTSVTRSLSGELGHGSHPVPRRSRRSGPVLDSAALVSIAGMVTACVIVVAIIIAIIILVK